MRNANISVGSAYLLSQNVWLHGKMWSYFLGNQVTRELEDATHKLLCDLVTGRHSHLFPKKGALRLRTSKV